jgi:triacylglycerol esterase/lipase EstA (alpha/beta hydrolase family)
MPLPTVILPGYCVPTLGGRSVTPILRKIDAAVKQALITHCANKVNLVGHSAGGWLARIYLGETPYCVHPQDTQDCVWHARSSVHTLLTLGTPHTSLERWTRKNLDFVNQTYPGAFYADVNYVCVAGKAIFGKRRPGSWLAYSSYKITGGEGAVWGDGITPITAAHLEGAKNLVLEGATHSPKANRPWYGSVGLIEEWANYLLTS